MNTPANSQDPDEDVDDKVERCKAELNAAAVEHFKLASADTYRKELLSKLESDRHHIAESNYNKGADDGIRAGILLGAAGVATVLFLGWLAWSAVGSVDTSKGSEE
jgi:hypothetical protein